MHAAGAAGLGMVSLGVSDGGLMKVGRGAGAAANVAANAARDTRPEERMYWLCLLACARVVCVHM